jgi:uncharacterized membrane protein
MSKFERNANWLTIALFVLLTIVSIAGAIWLPNPTAIHYNLSGKPDRWGSPATLLILPGITFVLLGILWAVPNAHPDFMNFPGPRTPENVTRQVGNTRLLLASMRAFLTGLFLIFQLNSVWAKLYNHDQLTPWVLLPLLAGLFTLIGIFVRRAYRLVPKQ